MSILPGLAPLCALISVLPPVCVLDLSNEDLGRVLSEAEIHETMEFHEYLQLVRQLGPRPAKTKEASEVKAAIEMVTKGKPTLDVDDFARIMGVVGMNNGEALNYDEIDDFKMQMGGVTEISVDDMVQILIDV